AGRAAGGDRRHRRARGVPAVRRRSLDDRADPRRRRWRAHRRRGITGLTGRGDPEMTSIQEYCASTGRILEASPPMAVAAQPLTWVDSPPWQRIESPEPSAVIYVDPGAHRDGFSPNAVATCARVAPAMDTEQAVEMIVATADALPDW